MRPFSSLIFQKRIPTTQDIKCEASDPNIFYPKIPQMMLACTVPDF